ncbi:MAG: hypothetical protein HC866_27155 [Leptolyngbyaceae cyanobacterium RU_5_1]|nr:hypothetical protein [Leptolyngbyaceae cyanobacterium RU_5_1]
MVTALLNCYSLRSHILQSTLCKQTSGYTAPPAALVDCLVVAASSAASQRTAALRSSVPFRLKNHSLHSTPSLQSALRRTSDRNPTNTLNRIASREFLAKR